MIGDNTISVLGSGAWGSALASHLSFHGRSVYLWNRKSSQAYTTNTYIVTPPPAILKRVTDLDFCLHHTRLLLVAIPSEHLRSFLQDLSLLNLPKNISLVLLAKGLEVTTGFLPSQILADILPHTPPIILSGPSFAKEVSENRLTFLNLACTEERATKICVSLLETPHLRLRPTKDVVGVQWGGILKNIYAIGAGALFASQAGQNTHAAFLVLAFREMEMFIKSFGGKEETAKDVAGLGDLFLSASSSQSRNYCFGMNLVQHNSTSNNQTIEGARSTKIIQQLLNKKRPKPHLPLLEALCSVSTKRAPVAKLFEVLESYP